MWSLAGVNHPVFSEMLEADIDYSNPQTDIEKVQFIARNQI